MKLTFGTRPQPQLLPYSPTAPGVHPSRSPRLTSSCFSRSARRPPDAAHLPHRPSPVFCGVILEVFEASLPTHHPFPPPPKRGHNELFPLCSLTQARSALQFALQSSLHLSPFESRITKGMSYAVAISVAVVLLTGIELISISLFTKLS